MRMLEILGFTPRDFVIFGLPYKNPKTSLYVRRNGALTFTITFAATPAALARREPSLVLLAHGLEKGLRVEANRAGLGSGGALVDVAANAAAPVDLVAALEDGPVDHVVVQAAEPRLVLLLDPGHLRERSGRL